MSIRAQLKASVASCMPQQTQHATFRENNATGSATKAQQNPENPHETTLSSATANATAPQQRQKTSATSGDFDGELRVAFTRTRNSQLSAYRLTKQVIAAAMRRCDEFGDSEAARAEMVKQCLELSPEMQADLLAHFADKPIKF